MLDFIAEGKHTAVIPPIKCRYTAIISKRQHRSLQMAP
jgi:hypothetical protein